jgi:general secretion pathway protein I
MRLRPVNSRPALSLLEVIISLAVFLLSLVGLGHLVTAAGSIAHEAQHRSQAGLLAQSKMAEVAAGAVPLSSQSSVPFDEDPNSTWSLDVQQGSPAANLFNVTVSVRTLAGKGSTR